MEYGCKNCKFCKCYRGDYWTPNEYACVVQELDISEENFIKCWENAETWTNSEEPLCNSYEEAPTEEDEYWEEYAYKERYYENI